MGSSRLSTVQGLKKFGMKPVKITEFLKANELSIIEARELVDYGKLKTGIL